MAEFDKVEHDIVNLSSILGLAYGPAWSGGGLRLAQVVRALKVKVEDHGYDQLSSDDRAAFQNAQLRRPFTPRAPSALEMTVIARAVSTRDDSQKAERTVHPRSRLIDL